MRPPSPGAPETRERILAAAEDCFVEAGYTAGTRRIAERAGVTQPLLLHHFGSKDGLFTAVIERALGRLMTRQAAAFAPDADDLDFVVLGLRALVRATLEDPALLRLATWARLAGRTPYTAGASAYWQRLRARFAAAQRAGVVRADIDAPALLIVLDAAIKGFGERWPAYAAVAASLGDPAAGASASPSTRPTEPPPDLPHALPPGLAEALYDVLLQGLLTPAALPDARRRLAARPPNAPPTRG